MRCRLRIADLVRGAAEGLGSTLFVWIWRDARVSESAEAAISSMVAALDPTSAGGWSPPPSTNADRRRAARCWRALCLRKSSYLRCRLLGELVEDICR